MNKKTKLAWLWGTIIVLVMIIGSAAYFLINGGTQGLEANKIKATNATLSDDQSKAFNKARTTDNIPTMETVRSEYKKRFGDISNDSDAKIKSNITKMYGSTIADFATRGLLLSEKMTPDQVKQAEVTLIYNDETNNTLGGLTESVASTNIRTGKLTVTPLTGVGLSLNQPGTQVGDGSTLFKQDGKMSVSSPYVVPIASDVYYKGSQKSSSDYLSVIVFAKVGDHDTVNSLKQFASNMNVTISGIKLKPSGENSETSTNNIYNGGLGWISQYTGKEAKSSSQKIAPGAILPLTFDVKISDMEKLNDQTKSSDSLSVSVDGTDYELKSVDSVTAAFSTVQQTS